MEILMLEHDVSPQLGAQVVGTYVHEQEIAAVFFHDVAWPAEDADILAIINCGIGYEYTLQSETPMLWMRRSRQTGSPGLQKSIFVAIHSMRGLLSTESYRDEPYNTWLRDCCD